MDKAVKESARRFKETYTPINGTFVNTRDRLVPANIGEISKAHLEDFAKAHPEVELSNITLAPDTEAQDYWLIRDEFGQPVEGSPRFHISQLQTNPHAYSMADANKEVRGNR